MSTLTLRSVKGSPLTNTEVDNNFSNLNTDKLEATNNLSDVSNVDTARSNLGAASSDDALALAIALG